MSAFDVGLIVTLVYAAVAWGTMELLLWTNKYYTRVYGPVRDQFSDGTLRLVLVMSLFVLPAWWNLIAFWWGEWRLGR